MSAASPDIRAHTGHCLCGAVAATARGAMRDADACHCAMCRRQNAGGAFYAAHFAGGVELSGETIRWYAASEHGERAFCATCGSTLGWRMRDAPTEIGVSLGLFDRVPGRIGSRIFTDEAADYTTLPRDVPHLTGAEFVAQMTAGQDTP